ncbi:MAG: alpha/beta hydrolase [Alphaproteobacteria bacterium]|nr:alpha/beta hydrolase [Alphaproteobacteria bacterium]
MPTIAKTERIETASIPPLGLEGILGLPASAIGLVLFARGSGSSRHSPRNNQVAAALRRAALATLLFDLLTEREADDRANVFDIALLASRLLMVTDWAKALESARALPIGYFGASTGAAAALVAAAHPGNRISAIVSRGGRPDLAGDALARVTAPTLLIVGGSDTEVLALNRSAQRVLGGESALRVVPHATHLFEESGALETVTDLAREWFLVHMPASARR